MGQKPSSIEIGGEISIFLKGQIFKNGRKLSTKRTG